MLNHVSIMGRLTRDPELRRTGNGTAVASFSVACDRDMPDKNTGNRETDFFDCVAWRSTGEFISRNFRKGAQICVDGRLQTRKWQDKNGANRTSVEIVVNNAYFAGARGESSPSGNANSTFASSSYPETEALINSYESQDFAMLTDDDSQLPF